MLRLAVLSAALCFAVHATAAETHVPDDSSPQCMDAAGLKEGLESGGAQWVELPRDAWRFLEGVYARAPDTPAGLPSGDKAALVKAKGHDGGMVFFLDGDQVCGHMRAPKQLLDLLDEVMTGETTHQGKPL